MLLRRKFTSLACAFYTFCNLQWFYRMSADPIKAMQEYLKTRYGGTDETLGKSNLTQMNDIQVLNPTSFHLICVFIYLCCIDAIF